MTQAAAAQNTLKWYSIHQRTPQARAAAGGARAAAVTAAEVFIYGDIGASWWEETVTAKAFVEEINALKVDALTVRINSFGGSVPDGLAIYNALKRHQATVTTVVDAVAYSIASLIFMAGDVREMPENALVMVHAPWTVAMGNAEEFRAQADMLDAHSRAMVTSYAAATGRPAADLLAWLTDGQDHYFTAAEALAEGLATAVVAAMPIAASLSRDGALQRFARNNPTDPVSPLAAVAASTPKEPAMTTPVTTPTTQPAIDAAAAAQAQVLAAAQAEGVRAEAARRADIDTAFARFSSGNAEVQALQARCLADTTVNAAAAKEQLLGVLGRNVTPANPGTVTTVEDQRDKLVAAGTQAIMARAGVTGADGKRVVMEAANPFRGLTLLEMARASLARAGVRTEGMDKRTLVAAAFTQSTSDFPVLLENTMHKTLLAAYAIAPDTWRRFCKVGSVSDFRAHNRYRVGGLGNLDAKNELGEFVNKTIPDGEKSSIAAGTVGNIINLSRESIINDDLDAFVGLSAALGRSANRTVEAAVYALLAENTGAGPTMSDGNPLFHASHSNIAAVAGAPSMTTVDAARVLMASQKDVNAVDYLDLRPATWLGPISLGSVAREVNAAEYNDESNKQQRRPNTVRGLFRDIVDTPRLSGTRWYMLADPMDAAAIEVVFLDGVQEPFLEMEQGFDVDGSRWKVRLDFGTDGHDWRGAVTNAGA